MHIQREQVIDCGLVQRSMGPHGARPGRGDRSQADPRGGIPDRLGGWLVHRTGWLRDGIGSRRVGVRRPPAVPGAGRGGPRGAGDDPAPRRTRAPGRRCGPTSHDAASVPAALEGCDAAYYLVHSLGQRDFRDEDAEAARAFGKAAAEAGLEQIIYLGGLGDEGDDLSAHLRSRREVEGLLGEAGVPVTVLRAGIIVGHGGISWEMTRQLVEHLPAMITPRWVHTRTQPIAVDDVVRYLVGVLQGRGGRAGVRDRRPRGAEYVDMMRRVAEIEGRRMPIVPVPLLSPGLSSRWLALVTDVDTRTGRSLIDSMTNEVVVRDDSIRALVPFEPMGYDEAVLAGTRRRARAASAR